MYASMGSCKAEHGAKGYVKQHIGKPCLYYVKRFSVHHGSKKNKNYMVRE